MAERAEGEIESHKCHGDKELDLAKCASDFAQYCQVDVTEESNIIENTIEEMLARLDEFSHLADTIRNDSSDILNTALPQLLTKCQGLPDVFKKIDQLEIFVNAVKKNVDEMEDKVIVAEREIGTNSIKKVLSSISVPGFRQKKSITQPKDKKNQLWEPPTIFKTSDFFNNPSQDLSESLGS